MTCQVVKDVLVCGGEVADQLLALQVVAAALQAPEITLLIKKQGPRIKSDFLQGILF